MVSHRSIESAYRATADEVRPTTAGSTAKSPPTTEMHISEKDFVSTSAIFESPIDFAIISYVSYHDYVRDGHDSDQQWARTTNDRRKISAAWRYIREQDNEMQVWVDAACWHDEGVEQYEFSPFKTLGALYKYAKYTLSIIEGEDALWLEEITSLWQTYKDNEDADAFARDFFEVERCTKFESKIARNRFSYWNRAWILQELLQSNAVLYCSWNGTCLSSIVTGSILGEMIVATTRYRRTPAYSHPPHDWRQYNPSSERMWTYLRYAVPATVRARINLDYHYQNDISTAILLKKYYATDRKNALEAMAVLLGLNVFPVEKALARAVHHAMIRNGSLPTVIFAPGKGIQPFANSSWAPRHYQNYHQDANSTEELTTYFPTPIPGEILPDGRLGVVGSGISAMIMPERDFDDIAVRDLSVGSKVIATLSATHFNNVDLQESQPALLLRTESVTFLICPAKQSLLGSFLTRLIPLATSHIAEGDWRTTFMAIK